MESLRSRCASDLKERLVPPCLIIEAAEALMLLDLAGAPPACGSRSARACSASRSGKLADVQTIQRRFWNEDSSWVSIIWENLLERFRSA